MLTALLDPGPAAALPWEPAPPPSLVDVALDRVTGWWRAVLRGLRLLSRPVSTVRSWREAWDVLLAGGPSAMTSLNHPNGVSRRLVAVNVDLEEFHAMARSAGGTINDAVLAAVATGLERLNAARGETPELLYASIPVALQQRGSANELGNRVTGMRVPLRMGPGTFTSRIKQIAGYTRMHKAYRLDPAAVGLFAAVRNLFGSSLGRWYIARQRLINVFVTNMVGRPSRSQCLAPRCSTSCRLRQSQGTSLSPSASLLRRDPDRVGQRRPRSGSRPRCLLRWPAPGNGRNEG